MSNPEQLGRNSPAGASIPNLRQLGATALPVEVEGDRNDPEEALANLLQALDALGIITDSTEAGV